MWKLTVILLLISSYSIASDHEYWRVPEYKTLNQRNAEEELRKEHRMLQGLQRELRDTGQISPKSQIDIYNLKEGYGYDGGSSDYDYDY